MSLRSLLLMWCVVAAVPLLGCSAPAPACTSKNCTGCCDASGQCQAGGSEGACGTGGLSCVACGGDSFCSLGFCVPRGMSGSGGGGGSTGGGGGTSSCNASNCAGCCSGGVCQPGSSASACGANGAACTTCGGGQTCSSETKTCTGPSGACDARTCPSGCCQGDVCMPGNSSSACGLGGASCSNCGEARCLVDSRVCEATSTCNATTCPGGCCAGNTCLPGNTAAACGVGGASCGLCGEGQTCSSQRCVATSTCNASTCPSGCCQGNVCMPGTSTAVCGVGGATCGACGSGQSCSSGQCVFACNASTCPSGCCSGSTCLPGTTSAACGTSGAACSACGANQACDGTTCVTSCNASTCPSGCCQGDVCLAGTSNSACGSGGLACATCSGTTSCNAGACTGGGTLSGDTCATAVQLTLPSNLSSTLSGYANDFVSGTTNGCHGTQGIDRVYKFTVPAGERLTATVTPTGTSFDPTLSLVLGSASACVGTSAMCVASVDVGNAGAAETLTWTNSTGAAVTAYLVVEEYSATVAGAGFTLAVSSSAPAAGDTCASPIAGTSGVAVSRTPSTFTNDYEGSSSSCATPSTGPDFVVSYVVPNGRSLTVTATPASGLDVSVNLATSTAACASRTCVAAVNRAAAGGAETVAWNNSSGASQTVFVIVDTGSSPSGAVSVVATEGATLGCGSSTCPNGCCSAGQCQVGTASSACGSGGAACSACSSPAQCNASQVCSATDLPTGSPCTDSAQCYQPVLGSAQCITTWPGGYCSGSCLLTEQVCGGFLSLSTGWCTPAGECLQDCASPGQGQSSCRSGYVCEFSNGAGSQGVCVPKCQSVACSTGTCNAAGYCR